MGRFGWWLGAGALVVIVLLVSFDNGSNLLGPVLGFVALLVLTLVGFMICGAAVRQGHWLPRVACATVGLACVAGTWVVNDHASRANEAFARASDGVPLEEIAFVAANGRSTTAGEEGGSSLGPIETVYWKDWLGSAYSVSVDMRNNTVVQCYQACFGKGVWGARYIGIVSFGFVVGLISLPLESLLRHYLKRSHRAE